MNQPNPTGRALLARPNDLARELMRETFEGANLEVFSARDEDHLAELLAEPWQAVAVSTSVSSVVQQPWREVLSLVGRRAPAAELVLVTIEWSPELIRRLRPEFCLVTGTQPATRGQRGVLHMALDQLRDAAERRDLSTTIARRLKLTAPSPR